VTDEAESHSINGGEVLARRRMVVEVQEDDFLCLLQLLEFGSGNILHAVTHVDRFIGKADQVAKAAKTVVLDALSSFEKDDSGIPLHAHILAESTLRIAVDLPNAHFALHFAPKLFPICCHSLTVMAPWRVELDKPGVLRCRHQMLEAFSREGD
jgi:hypothetical protein